MFIPLFNIGELIPLKGVHWKVVGCSGDKLVLQAVGETQKRKRQEAEGGHHHAKPRARQHR